MKEVAFRSLFGRSRSLFGRSRSLFGRSWTDSDGFNTMEIVVKLLSVCILHGPVQNANGTMQNAKGTMQNANGK